jgi:A/G-specific adenine glycosylase
MPESPLPDPVLAQRRLLDWYARQGRNLPWRRTRDPYRILVSEVMLQQTQVDRVIPYFERFIQAFPDPAALAVAGDEHLHRLWKGLGYPSRADRLRATCRQVVAAGGWPGNVEGLLELPGIGPYTAAAVACFALGRPEVVLDTNIARVVARFALGGTVVPSRQDLVAACRLLMPTASAIPWHNALMDLGARICTAREAACDACPWAESCRSRGQAAAITALATPLKAASTKRTYGAEPDRSLPRVPVVLGLIHHDGRYLVARRPPDRHAGGVWELPGGKRQAGEQERAALARELGEELGVEVLAARHLMRFAYNYPDRCVQISVYRVRLFDPAAARPLDGQTELRWVTPAELLDLPFPPANAAIQARMRRYHRL